MKIAMFVEGCYPYVVGGVSSWVQMLLEASRDFDFSIYSLLPDREQSGQFKYKMPSNVLEIRETYLNDDDVVNFFRKKQN